MNPFVNAACVLRKERLARSDIEYYLIISVLVEERLPHDSTGENYAKRLRGVASQDPQFGWEGPQTVAAAAAVVAETSRPLGPVLFHAAYCAGSEVCLARLPWH
jgi:hypothetical protein